MNDTESWTPIPVAGHCPMCGHDLMLNAALQIECRNIECPDEDAVHKLLQDTERTHIVTVEDDRFHVKHPLRERINDEILTCTIHERLTTLPKQPKPGSYRVSPIDPDPDSTSLHADLLYFEDLD